MRTTITIDDDIAAKLKAKIKKSKDLTFKALVNETLRRGLLEPANSRPRKAFKVKSRSMGIRKGLNYDNIGELLEQIEGPNR
ncbi:MAG: DUF2191 domain-containing protein [Pyrinomonadaceae bacterium]